MAALATSFLILAPASAVGGQTVQAEPKSVPEQLRVRGSVLHTMVSKQNGVAYRLTVLLPVDHKNDGRRYPVLYVLDGDWLAPLMRSVSRWAVEDGLLVVGIDSDDPDHHWQDMPTAGHDRHWDVKADRGAANFLNIIRQEIKPYIDATYATSGDAGIAGHSLGGFFSLYAGFHAPEMFRHVIAFSPSLVWQDNVLLRQQADIAKTRTDLPVRFYVDFGGLEPQSDRADSLGNAVLARGYPSVRWQNVIVPNQTHASLPFADAVNAMNAVYGPELRQVDQAELTRISGRYRLDDGTSIALFPRDGQLMMRWSTYDDEPIVLLSSQPGRFFIRELGTRVELGQPGGNDPDIVVFTQPTPGPNGANVTPRIEGKKLLPGRDR